MSNGEEIVEQLSYVAQLPAADTHCNHITGMVIIFMRYVYNQFVSGQQWSFFLIERIKPGFLVRLHLIARIHDWVQGCDDMFGWSDVSARLSCLPNKVLQRVDLCRSAPLHSLYYHEGITACSGKMKTVVFCLHLPCDFSAVYDKFFRFSENNQTQTSRGNQTQLNHFVPDIKFGVLYIYILIGCF